MLLLDSCGVLSFTVSVGSWDWDVIFLWVGGILSWDVILLLGVHILVVGLLFLNNTPFLSTFLTK